MVLKQATLLPQVAFKVLTIVRSVHYPFIFVVGGCKRSVQDLVRGNSASYFTKSCAKKKKKLELQFPSPKPFDGEIVRVFGLFLLV